MTSRSRARHALLLAVAGLLLWPREAHAYLDPGTGSLVIQTIIAGLAAVGYAFRSSLGKVASLFRPGRRRQDSTPADRDR
ncbi:MAG: hypothetical protein R2752_20550 [Vicinamibacterales bacterium]